MSYGSMLPIPPTNCLLLTAKQEPYKKAYLLTKNIEEFSGKSWEERASRQMTTHTVSTDMTLKTRSVMTNRCIVAGNSMCHDEQGLKLKTPPVKTNICWWNCCGAGNSIYHDVHVQLKTIRHFVTSRSAETGLESTWRYMITRSVVTIKGS